MTRWPAKLCAALGGMMAMISAGCLVGEISSPALPPLELSEPSSGAIDVPRSSWIRLRFAEAVDDRGISSVALRCGGQFWTFDVDRVASQELVLNPRTDMLAGGSCEVSWMGPEGLEKIGFAVAPLGDAAVIP